MSGSFYEENHEAYYQQTVGIDPAPFLEPLIRYLPPASLLLDVGCGSGRDLRWFKERGYRVVGMERSRSLARMAADHAGCEIHEADFRSFDFRSLPCDAILLVGALVHVPHESLSRVFLHITQGLRPRGKVLLTLKEGRGSSSLPDGRVFYLWEDQPLRALIASSGFTILDVQRQISAVRPKDVWLGYVLEKPHHEADAPADPLGEPG